MGTLIRRFCIVCMTGSAFSAMVALIITMVGILFIQVPAQSVLMVSAAGGSIAGSLTAALTIFKTRAKAPANS